MTDLHTHVRAILNEADPCHLHPGEPGHAPIDEYDPEAESISRHLIRAGSIDIEELDGVWMKWFDERLSKSLGTRRTEVLVASLNSLMPEQ